ncbi:MAG: hypothetical protein GXP42_02755 [Chloroflexi bacterium]|nr:hypothetical protein [Chloroflexota bacterium]
MIVVDENIHDRRIMDAILDWYPGKVVSITSLRPGTIIKDDAIPGLLLKTSQPTFVTINVEDFWKKVSAHDGYCIVTIALPVERSREAPLLLRRLFRSPPFNNRAKRMGKVIRLAATRIEYYGADGKVRVLEFE